MWFDRDELMACGPVAERSAAVAPVKRHSTPLASASDRTQDTLSDIVEVAVEALVEVAGGWLP